MYGAEDQQIQRGKRQMPDAQGEQFFERDGERRLGNKRKIRVVGGVPEKRGRVEKEHGKIIAGDHIGELFEMDERGAGAEGCDKVRRDGEQEHMRIYEIGCVVVENGKVSDRRPDEGDDRAGRIDQKQDTAEGVRAGEDRKGKKRDAETAYVQRKRADDAVGSLIILQAHKRKTRGELKE